MASVFILLYILINNTRTVLEIFLFSIVFIYTLDVNSNAVRTTESVVYVPTVYCTALD